MIISSLGQCHYIAPFSGAVRSPAIISHRQVNLIHIAGVIDHEEAQMLISCGATHLGFPLVLGHHKEDLSPEAAAGIVSALRDQAEFFLITYLKRAAEIVALCQLLGVRGVQLHDDITPDEVARLRSAWPDLHIIKSIIIRSGTALHIDNTIKTYSPHVDASITDTHDPVSGAIGATGKTHDWDVSRHIVATSPCPVILAGGLNPDNVASAIRKVQPAGVDVHTGIEDSSGRKDRSKTQRFIDEARNGFAGKFESGA